MNVLLAIPARFGSTRFEGKPLTLINGKTMIQRVVEQCQKVSQYCNYQINIVVATDDSRIFDHVSAFATAIMTAESHESGTDRIAEVVQKSEKQYDVVINVQGDEPLIQPEQIVQLINCFQVPGTQLATLVKPEPFDDSLLSPNAVKCIVDKNLKAIYFSRFPIPFYRNEANREGKTFYRHVGMYGYTPEALLQITSLPPSSLEKAESLEQLRWIENGYQIQTAITHFENVSVDSPEDLLKIKITE